MFWNSQVTETNRNNLCKLNDVCRLNEIVIASMNYGRSMISVNEFTLNLKSITQKILLM